MKTLMGAAIIIQHLPEIARNKKVLYWRHIDNQGIQWNSPGDFVFMNHRDEVGSRFELKLYILPVW